MMPDSICIVSVIVATANIYVQADMLYWISLGFYLYFFSKGPYSATAAGAG